MAFVKNLHRGMLIVALLSVIPVKANDITIGLGNFEPLFSKPDKPALFKDLIDGVYAYLPHRQVKFQYMLSNARLIHELNSLKLDGSANIFSQEDIKGCLSDPIFEYSDVAITVKSSKQIVNAISDLAYKSVVSYQGAKVLLGAKYKETVKKTRYYKEVSNPQEQAKLLLGGMVDVSIGDKYIFLNSLQSLPDSKNLVDKFQIHKIFPLVSTSMGFNNQEYCDEFNVALKQFKESGSYRKIYQHYLNKLGYIE